MMKNISGVDAQDRRLGAMSRMPRSTQAAVYSATPMWITMAEKIEMTVSQSRQWRLKRRSRKSGSVGTRERR